LLKKYNKLSGIMVDLERVTKICLVDTVGSAYWLNVCEDMESMKEYEMTWIIKKLKWFL
jgi:hypothetical protein